MKRWMCFVAAALAVCMLGSEAFAQPGRGGPGGGFGGFGGGGGGFGGPLGVLRDEQAREELGITDDQMEKLRAIQERMGERMRDQFRGLRDLSEDERRERFSQMREQMQEQQEELQKEIDGVLLPQQRDRLKQIALQQQMRFGAQNALGSPNVAKELGITDEQREKLQEAARAAEEELREKTDKLREEAREKVLSVLTASQREKLKQMIGEPANLGGGPGQRFGGQRGGGQGGRRGGGDRIERPSDGD
jgi:Spy/CpxP family protein refolding chaperone